jgi:hypothetical protein
MDFLCRHAHQKHTHLEDKLSRPYHYTYHLQKASNFSIYVDSIEGAKCSFDIQPRFHLSKSLIMQISKLCELALAAKVTFLFRNMSLVLPGTSRTNFCSTILQSFQTCSSNLLFVQWFSNHSRMRSSIQELRSHYVVYIICFRWRSQRGTSINHY